MVLIEVSKSWLRVSAYMQDIKVDSGVEEFVKEYKNSFKVQYSPR